MLSDVKRFHEFYCKEHLAFTARMLRGKVFVFRWVFFIIILKLNKYTNFGKLIKSPHYLIKYSTTLIQRNHIKSAVEGIIIYA